MGDRDGGGSSSVSSRTRSSSKDGSNRSSNVNAPSEEDQHKAFYSQLKDELLVNIRETIRQEIQPLVDRFDRMEKEIHVSSAIKTQVSEMGESLEFLSRRLDDVSNTTLPTLTTHVERVATALALQTLNIDVHRRKWSITIQGLKIAAGEEDEDTRAACVKLAKDKLAIADASVVDFAAYHRLSRKENAGVIARFRDLGMRKRWLTNAKNLRGLADDISISPDLPPPPPPPVLRPIKNELLTKRKSLKPDDKKKSHLKYLRQWPYVVLAVGKDKTIKPEKLTKTVISNIIGFSPLMSSA